MGKQFHATIEIDATPQRVWEVLTDFAAYPDWNRSSPGPAAPPAPASAYTCACSRPAAAASPSGPPCWRQTPVGGSAGSATLLLPGLFDGDHSFTIEPLGDRRVRVTQQEQFRGVLLPLAAKSLDRPHSPRTPTAEQPLKRRAEQPQHETVPRTG
jgi:hypothetical protein